VRKCGSGSLMVNANTITKPEEQVDGSGEERKIPFMKG
jgi:antirestriction protein ArdC